MADEVRVGENVAKLVGVWKRRKRLAIFGFAAAFAISATVTFMLPNIYQSGATLMSADQPCFRRFLDGPDSCLPTRPTRRPKIPLRSRLEQLIHQFDLYPTERTKLSPDALVERMRRDIEVKPIGMEPIFNTIRPTTMFTVKYQGEDPTTVALVANSLARYFIDEYPEFRILDPAVPARTPSAPNRPNLLVMSLALSTGLAIGLSLLAEKFDAAVHSAAAP